LEQDTDAIAREKEKLGRFVLASNDLTITAAKEEKMQNNWNHQGSNPDAGSPAGA
jgi:hypothetical protein